MKTDTQIAREIDWGRIEMSIKQRFRREPDARARVGESMECLRKITDLVGDKTKCRRALRNIGISLAVNKDLLKEVVNEQKPNIEAGGLKYTVRLDEKETYKIKADPDKFKQVVMNVIDNSVKYTKEGSISISLEKGAAKAGDPTGTTGAVAGIVRLTISDTGAGIAPDVLPKLFQKFSRAEHANEANIHGTGLGLYIAREIMNVHGGKIWAESAGEGKGSRFYVEVPLVK